MVAAVEAGSLADRTGLVVSDVLLSVVDESLDGFQPLPDALTYARDAIRLRVARGGVVFEVEVDLRVWGPGRVA